MKRQAWVILVVLSAGALCLASGCSFHSSPIRKWYFFDRRTGQPIDNVLLLEWTEKEMSRSREAQAFERQVPTRDSLKDVRGAMITRADPDFRPAVRTKIQGYAVTVWEGARFMAVHPAYGFRVKRANEEQLARLGVEGAADESIAYVVLTHETDPVEAADWLQWLANGRLLIAGELSWADRRRLYQAFALYWDRTDSKQGAQLSAELGTRPIEAARELDRIYREEVARPPPRLP